MQPNPVALISALGWSMAVLLNQGVAHFIGLAVNEFPVPQQFGQLLGKRTPACAETGSS